MTGLGDLKLARSRGNAGNQARLRTEHLERARAFTWLVRAGFVARGLTYGVIGGLALALALGAGTAGAPPNQQGALTLIARQGAGRAALIVISAGLLAYALWKLTQGVFGRGPEGGGGPGWFDRVGNIGGGIVYLGFLAVAIQVLAGSAGDSSQEPKQTTTGILGWPAGQLIVGIGGAVLIGISLYQLYDAVTGGFLDENKTERMDRRERGLFLVLGRVGLSARALVFVLIGYFVLRTAIEYKPGNAVGVDGALARLHHQPLGPWIVGLVGVGLLIFASYSFVEGWYRRL